MVLPSAPGKVLQVLFGEAVEQALHFARQRDQRVPGAVDREIVAAGIDDAHLAPELGHGAQHFQLAGEELLVEHRKRHVLLDGLHAPQAQAEIVHVAAQHAPDGAALRAAGQRLHRWRRSIAVVAGRGVARQHDAVGREVGGQAPGMLACSRRHQRRRLGRPADRRRLPHLGAECGREIAVGSASGRRQAARTAERSRRPAPASGVVRFRCSSSLRRLRITPNRPGFR